MKWQITFSDTARKQIAKLDRQARARVISFLDQRVASNPNPRSLGEALVGSKLGEYWRYRVGDYRVICEIQDERLVILAVAIGHRREIYR